MEYICWVLCSAWSSKIELEISDIHKRAFRGISKCHFVTQRPPFSKKRQCYICTINKQCWNTTVPALAFISCFRLLISSFISLNCCPNCWFVCKSCWFDSVKYYIDKTTCHVYKTGFNTSISDKRDVNQRYAIENWDKNRKGKVNT